MRHAYKNVPFASLNHLRSVSLHQARFYRHFLIKDQGHPLKKDALIHEEGCPSHTVIFLFSHHWLSLLYLS